jgi:hypothetical protein
MAIAAVVLDMDGHPDGYVLFFGCPRPEAGFQIGL